MQFSEKKPVNPRNLLKFFILGSWKISKCKISIAMIKIEIYHHEVFSDSQFFFSQGDFESKDFYSTMVKAFCKYFAGIYLFKYQ